VREYAPQYLPNEWTTDEVVRDRMRAQIAVDDPHIAAFFDKFETLFPADYEEVMTRSVAMYRRRAAQHEARQFGERYMQSFLNDNKTHLSAAEPASLVALGQAIGDGTAQLGHDSPTLCVEFLTAGGAPSFAPNQLSAESRGALVRITNAMLDSIASGRRAQVQYADPTEAQWAAWLERYANLGGDRSVLEALNSTAVLRTLPPDAVCNSAVVMWRAVLEAEDDFAARFVSYSMRQTS
jgi:hypothetical protein